MAWISDLTTGNHAGFALALRRDPATGNYRDGFFRAMGKLDHVTTRAVHALQAGCECGWRSPRVEVTAGDVEWVPYSPALSDEQEEQLRALWSAHVREVTSR